MASKEEKNIDEQFKQRVKQMYIHRNSKYGQFIIQTNIVQHYLFLLILRIIIQRKSLINKKLIKYLEESTLGNLINCFRICADSSDGLSLADDLEFYNNKRNALAHKMCSKNELKITDCVSSIELGDKLLIKLKQLIEIIKK